VQRLVSKLIASSGGEQAATLVSRSTHNARESTDGSFRVRAHHSGCVFAARFLFALTATGCASNTGSIGAVLAQSHPDGTVTLREAPPGLPAARAGMTEGDEILLIEGRDVRRMSPLSIHHMMEGDVGSCVQLTVLRRGKIERIAVERAPLATAPSR
jgi:S1-C subfamily serine protease